MRKGFAALAIPILILLFIASTFITIKFLNSKTQETKTVPNQQKSTQNDCNGLAEKSLKDIEWNTYKDTENNFSIEYPSVFAAEKSGDWVSFNVKKDNASATIWLKINNNPKHLDITHFWAENPPNDHAGELTSANYSQRLTNANSLLRNAKQLYVGPTNIKGYSLNIADVLERTEIYWLTDNNLFNLGFSPQDKSYGCLGDKKTEIVNHMLTNFKINP